MKKNVDVRGSRLLESRRTATEMVGAGGGEDPEGGESDSLLGWAPGIDLVAALLALESGRVSDDDLGDGIVAWEKMLAWGQSKQNRWILELARRTEGIAHGQTNSHPEGPCDNRDPLGLTPEPAVTPESAVATEAGGSGRECRIDATSKASEAGNPSDAIEVGNPSDAIEAGNPFGASGASDAIEAGNPCGVGGVGDPYNGRGVGGGGLGFDCPQGGLGGFPLYPELTFHDGRCVAELAALLNLSGGEARRRIEIAQMLDMILVDTSGALEAGVITASKAGMLVHRVKNREIEVAITVEDSALRVGAKRPRHIMGRQIDAAIILADPDGAGKAHLAARVERRVQAPRQLQDGMASLRAVVPADHAKLIHSNLTSIARARKSEGDPRNVDQLRADTLLLLATDPGCCHAAGPSATGQNAAGPSATGPSATGQNAAGPSATGPSATGQNAAGLSVAGSSLTGLSVAVPSLTGLSVAGSGATGPVPAGSWAVDGSWVPDGLGDASGSGLGRVIDSDSSPDSDVGPGPRTDTGSGPSPSSSPSSSSSSGSGSGTVAGLSPGSSSDSGSDGRTVVAHHVHSRSCREILLTISVETLAAVLSGENLSGESFAGENLAFGGLDGSGFGVGSGRGSPVVSVPFLTGYGPISPLLAAIFAGDHKSRWRLAATDETGKIVSVTARTYKPPADMARIIRSRQPECVFPSCDRPAQDCDLDHTIPYDHANPGSGGQTNAGNLAPLCRSHHNLKTLGFWHLAQPAEGQFEWTSALGRKYSYIPSRVENIATVHDIFEPARDISMSKSPGIAADTDTDTGLAAAQAGKLKLDTPGMACNSIEPRALHGKPVHGIFEPQPEQDYMPPPF